MINAYDAIINPQQLIGAHYGSIIIMLKSAECKNGRGWLRLRYFDTIKTLRSQDAVVDFNPIAADSFKKQKFASARSA